METALDMIRRRQFFREELRERVYWFIRLRWAALLFGLCGCGILYAVEHRIKVQPLVLTLGALGVCNYLYLAAGRRIEAVQTDDARPFELFANIQISLDLVGLFILIFFTGGISSPLLYFVVFHIILAGILLSPLSCYLYAVVITAASAGLIVLHSRNLPPDWLGGLAWPFFFQMNNLPSALLSFLAFASGLFIVAFLTTSLKKTLRCKARRLMEVYGEMERLEAGLELLREMMREVDSHSDLQGLMEYAVENAARATGVRASSIKLLDESKKRLRFAAVHGLGSGWLTDNGVSLEESEMNRKVLEGSLYSIGDINEKGDFQHPERLIREGVKSALCLPLEAGGRLLGNFCLYSGEPHFFNQKDADFFSMITGLTALAMESLKRRKSKNWFLNKTAHYLRSPLQSIGEMLESLEGEISKKSPVDKQAEMVGLCRRRLSGLQEVINDLLKLASGRRDDDGSRMEPVNLAESILGLQPMFLSMAEPKNINIQFVIPEGLPPVLGREDMVDELAVNLVVNAIKYNRPGGMVQVSLFEYSPEQARLEVRDNGIGISEADQLRLFTEFFRAENAKASGEEGTGLGLVLVKEILGRMGGSIEIRSQLGKGTTVDCFIPFARETRARAAW